MERFNYINFVNNNPLLKETSGYGNYTQPKLEDKPLGPDEELMEYEDQDDFYINVSVRDAKKALEILRDEFSNEIRNKTIQLDGSDSYVINDREVAMDLFDAFKLQGIEIINTDVEVEDDDFDGDEEELFEANVPDNIKRFAKKKGVSSLVNKVANWAEKAGKRIRGGTAIGKNYDTLILDLSYQDSAIDIDTDNGSIKVYGKPVKQYADFLAAIQSSGEGDLNEADYPRADFEQQLHDIVSKAKEANIPKEDLENMFRWSISDY